MKTLHIKEIPTDLGNIHENPKHEVLPKHEFTMGIVAPKGSGKTTLLINLLLFYKRYFHCIIIFSPTISNDDKWDYVKSRGDMLGENKKLQRAIEKIKQKQREKFKENPVVDNPPESFLDVEQVEVSRRDYDGTFDGHIPEDCFYEDYIESDLKDLMDQQQVAIKVLKSHGFSKHVANRICFVFDDLVGSTLFTNARENVLKRLNIRHRHYSASIIMIVQAYKEIPKTIRTNFSCLILFEIFSDAELDVIYDEFPMGLKKPQWLEMYHYAVSGDHGFLFYDMQKKKSLRIMKNFDQVLFFKDDKQDQKSLLNKANEL